MIKAGLRLVEETFIGKVEDPQSPTEWGGRQGLHARLGKNARTKLAMSATLEAEAELFARAEQVDLAEKAFHQAFARRIEAQIAYLRVPSILTRAAFEAAKAAATVAQEIFEAEIAWLANARATTVTGLKLKASYASTAGKLADCLVEDILQF
ncbi:MAG: hypothetical protein ACLP4V_00485 [Methylocella sp.]